MKYPRYFIKATYRIGDTTEFEITEESFMRLRGIGIGSLVERDFITFDLAWNEYNNRKHGDGIIFTKGITSLTLIHNPDALKKEAIGK
ncbi:hypothetical protein HRF55_10525 [Bacillus subtilis]|uniref:hypothetical protein n=1 Tax=Bacillus subtilis TaxID=1423 RepID=UPI0015615DE1|nr:hypothetical protein [Bacillus subtilis]NRF01227.1 hypothetical protein [Bacillus subtilis]NRG35518.1 hypothetical protein [Bacillus subtilis]